MKQTTTESEEKGSWLSRTWYILALIVIAIITVLVTVVSADNNAKAINAQEQRIEALNADIAKAKAAIKAKEDEALKEAVGLDASRRNADMDTINDLMASVGTWNDGAEYDKGRNTVLEQYEIPEDSQFMTEFFPEQPSKTSRSGDTYYEVDMKGLNSKVDNIETSLINIDGDKYTYLSLVEISSSSKDNKARVSNISIVRFTTDSAGKILDINGMITNSDINE